MLSRIESAAVATVCRSAGLPQRGNPMGTRTNREDRDSLKEMAHYAEEQRLGHGRIEFDELGNAIWVPASNTTGDEVMRRLLDDPTLAFSNDYSTGTQSASSRTSSDSEKGYDPYDSGQLVKKEWKKKKDLRKLSDGSSRASRRTNERLTLRAGTRSLGRMSALTLVVGSRNYSVWSLRAWMA
jgi:hypothetical protein